jgi:lipoyl-dependent peroxiredoxin
MKRKASAAWQGDLKTGKGTVSTESEALSNTQYSFTSRFENGKGTNPEELVAAAHAGCFTMALSVQLGEAGLVPEKLETTAAVTFEKLEAGWTVTQIHLEVKGKVPKANTAAWEKATAAAKTGCPISRLLNATITMDAKLES